MLTMEQRAILFYIADHYRNGGFDACVKPLRFLQRRYGDEYPDDRNLRDIYHELCEVQKKMLPMARHVKPLPIPSP